MYPAPTAGASHPSTFVYEYIGAQRPTAKAPATAPPVTSNRGVPVRGVSHKQGAAPGAAVGATLQGKGELRLRRDSRAPSGADRRD